MPAELYVETLHGRQGAKAVRKPVLAPLRDKYLGPLVATNDWNGNRSPRRCHEANIDARARLEDESYGRRVRTDGHIVRGRLEVTALRTYEILTIRDQPVDAPPVSETLHATGSGMTLDYESVGPHRRAARVHGHDVHSRRGLEPQDDIASAGTNELNRCRPPRILRSREYAEAARDPGSQNETAAIVRSSLPARFRLEAVMTHHGGQYARTESRRAVFVLDAARYPKRLRFPSDDLRHASRDQRLLDRTVGHGSLEIQAPGISVRAADDRADRQSDNNTDGDARGDDDPLALTAECHVDQLAASSTIRWYVSPRQVHSSLTKGEFVGTETPRNDTREPSGVTTIPSFSRSAT